jgi:membrane peptidoglycan carboxypeptidase
LPDVAELESRVSNFETALIFDREGNQLFSLSDPDMGSRTYVTLDQISPHLINATIATEDSRFYSNPGFDPIGIARAITQAALEREIVSGASTITQQLVRASLLDEEERTQVTFRRKVREIILAEELTRKVGKDKVLELYLNEIFYGNYAYGIEAASRTYFGKAALDLELHEASLLAGLPQAPALWDPYTAPELALGRQSQVLGLMARKATSPPPKRSRRWLSPRRSVRNLRPPERRIEHPHFVFTMLQQLEELLGAQSLYAGGLRVYTTLDPAAQQIAVAAVSEHRDLIRSSGANNAALVAIHPETGEVLALVGSLDYRDEEIRGQVNMALAPRQPGSSIKPLVYAAAMAEGWTPATLIWDVETSSRMARTRPTCPRTSTTSFTGQYGCARRWGTPTTSRR